MSAILRLLFGISEAETTFERRGFRGGGDGVRERLERVGPEFVAGYHAALEDDDFNILVPRLNRSAPQLSGFTYEGAAMGLAVRDLVLPWRRNRVKRFLQGPGDRHAYMVHVGVGWLLARKPGSVDRFIERLDPLLRWLAVDGYGFHEGYFKWPRYLGGQSIPRRLHGYARRAFDQGLGRSLWFIDGAEVERIPKTIAAFPGPRHADLWSGVGLASVYAGEVSESALRVLSASAGPFQPQLAQGASFAAKARHRAGNLTAYHDIACGVLCGMTASEAAHISDVALENLPKDGPEPSYETWRCRIQQKFASAPQLKV